MSSLRYAALSHLAKPSHPSGSQPFHPLPISLLVRPPTLIPRPETEHWVAHLTFLLSGSSYSSRPFTLLDIGTGTGCIPLALAAGLPSAKAVAVDREMSAVDLARENVELCKEVVGDRVTIVQADLFSDDFAESVRNHTPAAAGFDLVVSNPPYIPVADYAGLAHSVRGWEDRGALVGERRGSAESEETEADDGLLFYRHITAILDDLLVEEKQTRFPVVAFEVGAGQAPAVEELLRAKGLRAVSEKDQWRIGRLVLGYRM